MLEIAHEEVLDCDDVSKNEDTENNGQTLKDHLEKSSEESKDKKSCDVSGWDYERFIDIVNERMMTLRIKQNKLAELTGLTNVAISRYVNRENVPKLDTAIKIFKVLNISYNDIIYDSNPSDVGDYSLNKLSELLNKVSPEEQLEIIQVIEAWVNIKTNK